MRKQLLSRHLGCDIEELEDSASGLPHLYKYKAAYYIVLTDDEAYEQLYTRIGDLLHGLDLRFIRRHLKIDLPEPVLRQCLANLCDSCLLLFRELIIDIKKFIDEAVQLYGRGYFLAWCDKVEIKIQTDTGRFYYIYRVE